MTSKKAVQIVDMFIENRIKHIADLKKPENNLGYGIAAEMVEQDIDRMTREIGWFNAMKRDCSKLQASKRDARHMLRSGVLYRMQHGSLIYF